MSPETREETQRLAHSQCDKGLELSKENRAEDAIEEFNKAEINFESLQNFQWLNFLRKEKLFCLKVLNRHEEIPAILRDLETGYLETNNRGGLTQTLINRGEFYYEKEEYKISLKILNVAHYLLRADQNSLHYGTVQLNLAQNKICLEEYVEALDNLNSALPVYQKEIESREYVYCLRLSGYCYEKLFQVPEAERQYSLARKGYHKVDDKKSEGLMLRQLLQLYLDSYQTKKARDITLELKKFQD